MQLVISRERKWFATLLDRDSRIAVRGIQSTLSYSTVPLDPNLNPLSRRVFVLDDAHQNYLGIWDENTLIVWDLTRGVKALTVAPSLSSSSSKKKGGDGDKASTGQARFLDAKAFGDRWYAAVVVQSESHYKLQIHEYQNLKLVRIIKAGRYQNDSNSTDVSSSIFDVTNDSILVKSNDHIRVLNKKTGSKITKIGQKHITSATCHFYACQTLVVTVDSETHHVHLYDIVSGKRWKLETAISVEKTVQISRFTQGVDTNDSNRYTLLVDETTLYQIVLESQGNAARVESSRTIGKDDSTLVQLLISNEKKQQESTGVSLLAVHTQTWQAQIWNQDEIETTANETGRFEIVWTETESSDLPGGDDDNKKSKKRKATPSILGPGQAGGEATVQEIQTKRSKKDDEMADEEIKQDDDVNDDENHTNDDDDDDDNGPTIQERLRQLREAMNANSSSEEEGEEEDGDEDKNRKKKVDMDSAFSLTPKNATTESLTKLLQQAVSSGDTALLEVALQVRDSKIIANTLDNFLPNRKRANHDDHDDDDDDNFERNSNIISTLLAELTQRLATKPGRAEQLVPWIREVLLRFNTIRYHDIFDTSDQDIHALHTLQNLLQERLEVFPALLQLEGRLQQYLANNAS
jgi:hypothetical protein